LSCNVDRIYYWGGTSPWVDSGFWFVEESGCCSCSFFCSLEASFDSSAGGDSTAGGDSPTGSDAGGDSTTGSDVGGDSTVGSGAGGCQLSPSQTRIFASCSAISRCTSLLSTLTS